MREITDKKELAEFFRDTLLPYYEKHYREDLTRHEALNLYLENGLCHCALKVFDTQIYRAMGNIIGSGEYLTESLMFFRNTAKESLLPRIEWVKQFIKNNL